MPTVGVLADLVLYYEYASRFLHTLASRAASSVVRYPLNFLAGTPAKNNSSSSENVRPLVYVRFNQDVRLRN